MLLLVDANVLIDYAASDPGILELVSRHVGPIHVPRDILFEVRQLDEEQCSLLGITVVEPSLAQQLEAGGKDGVGGLSYQHWLCLIVARDQGWTCVTNDKPLRRMCGEQAIPLLWGLQLMLELVAGDQLTQGEALEVAERIAVENPLITSGVIKAFKRKVGTL